MATFWNERKLKCPVNNTKLHYAPDLDLSQLRKLFEHAINTYAANDFSELSALSSRLIARRSQSFRAQYGFKLLRKTNVAVSRLHNINIIELLSNFLGTLPDYQLPTKIAYPTKHNFDYILMRLQTISKLLLRIATCARESSCAFFKYIHRNFFWETCIMYIGLLSQIWTIAKCLCQKTIEIYQNFYPFREHFRNNKKPWLENDYVLPASLDDWIGADLKLEIIQKTSKHMMPLKEDNDAVKFLQTHFGEFLDDNQFVDDENNATTLIDAVKDENQIKFETIPKVIKREFEHIDLTSSPAVADSSNDIGQAINRDTMHTELLPNNCKSIDDIQQFLRCENNLRSMEKHKLSAMLNDNQWTNVRKEIERIIVTSQGRTAMKKFKKLWSITVNNPSSMN